MKLRTLLLLSALTLTGPALALADNAPSTTDRPGHPSAAVMQHLADGRIAFIQTALNLSSDQQKLWQPVADLLRQQSASHMHGDQKPGDHPTSLSDMLTRHAQALTKHAEFDEKLATALKSLETTLSPEQQQTLKIAFFDSMPHMQHRPGGFKSGHDGKTPGMPGNAPSDDGSQPG